MNLCQLEVVENDDITCFCKKLVFKQFGKPRDILEFKADTQILQALGPGEVLVRILAAPINPADLNFIEGTYGVKPSLPATPGIEGFGVVEVSNSVDFKAKDRVIFLRRAATWASYVIVSADALYQLPAGIDPLQAAMLKVKFVCAGVECQSPPTSQCSRCLRAFYCSKECQVADWRRHKKTSCRKKKA
jgi:D-arabinose 1-dehydrogenase-like Zn-dependent alcohol dehydrogenase